MNKESWEYYFFVQDMGVFEDPGGIYQKKLKQYEGKTLNEYINELGVKGWEMVNCTPYSSGMGTCYIRIKFFNSTVLQDYSQIPWQPV